MKKVLRYILMSVKSSVLRECVISGANIVTRKFLIMSALGVGRVARMMCLSGCY